jgi:hypothetical protein
MPKYRKKPIVVEAVQWYPGMNIPYVQEKGTMLPPEQRIGQVWDKLHEMEIEAKPGDWVVTGIRGEHYVVKDGVFQDLYTEEVKYPTPQEKAELAYQQIQRTVALNRKICEIGACIHPECQKVSYHECMTVDCHHRSHWKKE